MANSYNQHFKRRREISKGKNLVVRRKKGYVQHIDFKMVSLALVGFALSAVAYLNIDKVSRLLSGVEIRPSASARAESAKSVGAPEKESSEGSKKAEKTEKEAKGNNESASGESADQSPKAESKQNSNKEDQSYYTDLKERKEALDRRQEELDRREKELEELNRRLTSKIANLDKKRREIASLLENRIEVDGQKLGQLVEIYSSMKFENAAKIIETLDTDLAVALLGKMKKKSAASILNVMDPKKARLLSERYTGYK